MRAQAMGGASAGGRVKRRAHDEIEQRVGDVPAVVLKMLSMVTCAVAAVRAGKGGARPPIQRETV